MGLLRHRDDPPGGRRFQMRQKLASIGDDFWIEDDNGDRIYKVDGKALRLRDTFVLNDRDGHEVAKIQEKKLHVRDTMTIERGDETVATIHKALVGIRDRFDIDVEHGADLKARGNIVDHEYEIKRDGDVVATVSKKWFRVRDTYGIEIASGEDEALILALTVALDDMSHDRG
ncbi:MAG: LURP-one-related/scramblase family protein [Solirubrobacteraceae bacterium]